ncbi:S-type pyocin domain-containing protein [Pseudomonas syringae]|uniref:S-type pyocin domain-containing protein n=1 Tax=Pseudomonas syringae TaxID=317 RepID=UPI0009B2FBF6
MKRQTNILHDRTSGTVNISHGSSSKPQNTGFFGSGFTNTGASSSKRRRRRLQARAQQQAAQARARARARSEAQALAELQAAEQAAAQARAQAELTERARVASHAQAQAQAQAEKGEAHRRSIETLSDNYPLAQSGLASLYSSASEALQNTIQKEVESGFDLNFEHPSEQQLLDLVLHEKARINYLISGKKEQLDRQVSVERSAQNSPDSTQQDYRNYLEHQTQGDPALIQHAHQAWVDSLSKAYDAKLLAESIALLNEKSAALSIRHAELSLASKAASQDAQQTSSRQAAGIEKLWSIIAPAATTTAAPGIRSVATNIAKDQLIRMATRTLGSNLVTLLAMYPQPLGDAELPPAVIATPLSQLNLPPHIDLEYVASVKGTLDVPHRLVSNEAGTSGAVRWMAADGVNVGTKVRVRTFTYNAANNSYEFIRDGESTPTLIWTPIARPADGSTSSPAGPPALPVDPGNAVTPFVPELEAYPAIDRDDPDDYILISPIDSGLPNTYLLFKDPRSIPGVASGYGEAVTATWLRGSTASQPAPIPSSIAEKLSGRPFASFDKLREAIWLEVSKDPELSRHIGELNLEELSNKRAPRAPLADHVGKRVKYEIHHKHWVSDGGSVYDLDNLIIMTPKEHIQTHRKDQ